MNFIRVKQASKNDINKSQIELRGTDNDLIDPNFIMENLTELKNRSCQNNVWVDGIPERSSEIWKGFTKEVMKINIIKNKIDITINRNHERLSVRFYVSKINTKLKMRTN